MNNQQDATRRRILALARKERGTQTREEFFGEFNGISFTTYVNFESGMSWPRSRTLRHLERLLHWEDGIIDAVQESDMDPANIRLTHLRGEEPLTSSRSGLSGLSAFDTGELIAELARRNAASKRDYGLAASRNGGDGIGPEDLPAE